MRERVYIRGGLSHGGERGRVNWVHGIAAPPLHHTRMADSPSLPILSDALDVAQRRPYTLLDGMCGIGQAMLLCRLLLPR